MFENAENVSFFDEKPIKNLKKFEKNANSLLQSQKKCSIIQTSGEKYHLLPSFTTKVVESGEFHAELLQRKADSQH